jgi:ribose transport system permease protein
MNSTATDSAAAPASTPSGEGPAPANGMLRGGFSILLGLTLLGLLALLWVALGFATTSFWTQNNITNLLRQGSMTAILAIGQTFVIITGGIDLSVGAVVGFTSVIVAWLLAQGVPMEAAIVLTLLIGLAIGLFHGFSIVQLGLPPFIVTLATLTSLRGIGLLMTNGATISITNDTFTEFSRAGFLGIPSLFWMVILLAVPSFVFLHHSRWGRYLFAIGSNSEAARLSGVNVKRVIYLAYTLSAVFAAFVGLMLASRIGIGNATQAEGWELQAIASSVIGGASLFGAVGSVHGPLLGAFILATINNGANLLNVNSFWQRIITGALIIVIVYFDQLRRRSR